MKVYFPLSGRVVALCVAGMFTAMLNIGSALAAPPPVPLTVQVQGDGWVNSKPDGINCPADCNASYKKSSQVTLSATPNPDSRFLGWKGACTGAQQTCRFKIRKTTTVTALFEKATTTDTTVDTGLDITGEQNLDTSGSVPADSSITSDQTTTPDDTTMQTLQILWPVQSVNK